MTNSNSETANEEEDAEFRLQDDEDPKAKELEAMPGSEQVTVYCNVQAFEGDVLGSLALPTISWWARRNG